MYVLELLELGIDLGLDEVEDVGNAVVLSGKRLVLLHGVDCQESDKDAGENDGLHLFRLRVYKSMDPNCFYSPDKI